MCFRVLETDELHLFGELISQFTGMLKLPHMLLSNVLQLLTCRCHL